MLGFATTLHGDATCMRRYILTLLLTLSPLLGQATSLPTAPTSRVVDIEYSLPAGGTYRYAKSDCTGFSNCNTVLQTAINTLVAGDVLEVEAGTTFSECVTLPDLTTSNDDNAPWTYIISSAVASLPEGRRIDPTRDSAYMPIIDKCAASRPALQTQFGTDHYRIVGIKIQESQAFSTIVRLGWEWNGSTNTQHSTLAELPHHIIFDRVWITHTHATNNASSGILLNQRGHSAVIHSYIDNIRGGSDAAAIFVWEGTGPILYENNFLESTTENLMFGGEEVVVDNNIISDVWVLRNHLFKRLSWADDTATWNVKNLFEIKCGVRFWIEGNVLENNWSDNQTGRAILFHPRDQYGPTYPGGEQVNAADDFCVVQDITFKNNIIENSPGAFSIDAQDVKGDPGVANNDCCTTRILIDNNKIFRMNSDYGNSTHSTIRCFELYGYLDGAPLSDLTITRNLCITDQDEFAYGQVLRATTPSPNSLDATNFTIQNNILAAGEFDWWSRTEDGGGIDYTSYSIINNGTIFEGSENNYATRLSSWGTQWGSFTGNIKIDTYAGDPFTDWANGDFTVSGAFATGASDGGPLGPDYTELTQATRCAEVSCGPGEGVPRRPGRGR